MANTPIVNELMWGKFELRAPLNLISVRGASLKRRDPEKDH